MPKHSAFAELCELLGDESLAITDRLLAAANGSGDVHQAVRDTLQDWLYAWGAYYRGDQTTPPS